MFNEIIKKLRIDNNMSQDELSKKIDVSAQLVSKWENDLSTPNPEMLNYLADLFNVSVDYLIGRNNYKEKTQDEKLIELMKKAENNYRLKMIFDKASRAPTDKELDKIEKMIDLIIEEDKPDDYGC